MKIRYQFIYQCSLSLLQILVQILQTQFLQCKPFVCVIAQHDFHKMVTVRNRPESIIFIVRISSLEPSYVHLKFIKIKVHSGREVGEVRVLLEKLKIRNQLEAENYQNVTVRSCLNSFKLIVPLVMNAFWKWAMFKISVNPGQSTYSAIFQ